jgi:16S rRNA (guanine1516-N2)-methyltransferase
LLISRYSKSEFALGFEAPALREQALRLAVQLNLPLSNQVLPRLSLTADKLVLCLAGFTPLSVDFEEGLRDAQHALIRACKPRSGLRIIDATAGWGRDAGHLARFGAEVVMLERDPVMVALLQDGLRRAPADLKLSLKAVDAMSFLQNLQPEDYPDVIYLDPMHPLRQKSALVKKDLQALQHFIAPSANNEALLNLARQRVRQHVVMKWPRNQTPLGQAHASIKTKTVCFHFYSRQDG